MALESGSFINDLTVTNPASSDPVGQGDDHLRLIKSCVQGSLPNLGGIIMQPRSQDTSGTISSVWNTSHLVISASATTTVVLATPVVGSITTGFTVDFTTLTGAALSLLANGATTINGAASAAMPPLSMGRLFFQGGGIWRFNYWPAGATGLFDNVTVNGTLTVSGAATFNGAVSISGAAIVGTTLGVRGAVTLDSTLSVSGAAVFKGAMSIGGAFTCAGAATISGATTLNSTLTVSGAATFKSGASISGALAVSGALSIGGATQLTGFVTLKDSISISGVAAIGGLINLLAGQIAFPASQNASAGANTLDDYEEGTWTPTITFQVVGDLVVTYSTRVGQYTKIGDLVHIDMRAVTSAYAWNTSTGDFRVTGLPFNALTVTNHTYPIAAGTIQGLVNGADGSFCPVVPANNTIINIYCNSEAAGTTALMSVTQATSGVTKDVNVGGTYKTAT